MKQGRAKTAVLCTAGLLGMVLAAGCSKKDSSATASMTLPPQMMAQGEPAEPITGPFAAGKTVFRQKCARCHSTDGKNRGPMGRGPMPGGPMAGGPPAGGPPMGGGPGGFRGMMRRGPDLAKVSADPKHTRQWITDHILDPQAHKPESKMPKFAGKINDNDLKALVDYLASLKGTQQASGASS